MGTPALGVPESGAWVEQPLMRNAADAMPVPNARREIGLTAPDSNARCGSRRISRAVSPWQGGVREHDAVSDVQTVLEALREKASPDDVQRMASRLFITEGADRGRKTSAFWVLLVLSGIIAGTGVTADSTATVIGAMIVAPLMTPILGTALSIVLSDRRRIFINALIVLSGIVLVILIGFLLGLINPMTLTADTNGQIASRVSPRLIDLMAALATGAVGAFATVRSDVSDTLPGVAIAISLVPPLAVVGLTLESGALGALLLFGTNVTAIIATGTLIFLSYGVRRAAVRAGLNVGDLRRSTLATVLGALAVVAIPLAFGSAVVIGQQVMVSKATPVANSWAQSQGWRISDINYRQNTLRIVAVGPPPTIDEAALRAQLDAAGLANVDARVTLVLGGSKELPSNP